MTLRQSYDKKICFARFAYFSIFNFLRKCASVRVSYKEIMYKKLEFLSLYPIFYSATKMEEMPLYKIRQI